ncbi:hypothetical protein [Candidatus Nanohalovita haloferacivicina]|uniref:hypothetical protein n=1 Tax=Candidatus Nanohalovita haloferacivicina TaxID=2978046 RepID=UPI00325FB1A2|nr:hypothetical protein HBNXNv_0053 [Candidatus Nanohalobia archaeon BNXNv]
MNEEAIGGGLGAIMGAYVLSEMLRTAPVAESISTVKWMPPVLVILGVFLIIAGIFGVE